MVKRKNTLTYEDIHDAIWMYEALCPDKRVTYNKGWFEIRNNGQTTKFPAEIYKLAEIKKLIGQLLGKTGQKLLQTPPTPPAAG